MAKWQDWEPGQPNNWGGQEDCVQYIKNTILKYNTILKNTGQLRDDMCDTKEALKMILVRIFESKALVTSNSSNL